MPTLYLALAVCFEVAWALLMRESQGFTRLWPSVFMGICYVLSAFFLSLAAKPLGVSLAYAVWVGCGTAIIAAVGMLKFGEPVSALRLASLALVIVGVVGLNLSRKD